MSKERNEIIRERMFENVPNYLSKIQGSFLFDVISPVSIELENIYNSLDRILQKNFLKNTEGELLDVKAEEFGVWRRSGKKAKGNVRIKGVVGRYKRGGLVQTAEGFKFRIMENFSIKEEDLELGVLVKVESLQIGSKYNVPKESVASFPVKINGLNSVLNEKAFTEGADIENDQELLKRILFKIRNPTTSGNENHYKEWALQVPGVYDAKVISQGMLGEKLEVDLKPSEVKVLIIDRDKRPCTILKQDETSDYIESIRPVGATVIVKSPEEKEIRIFAKIKKGNGKTLQEIDTDFQKLLEEYRSNLVFKEREISIAKIGAMLIGMEDVIDYEGILLNEKDKNITLNYDQIPMFVFNLEINTQRGDEIVH